MHDVMSKAFPDRPKPIGGYPGCPDSLGNNDKLSSVQYPGWLLYPRGEL